MQTMPKVNAQGVTEIGINPYLNRKLNSKSKKGFV